MNDAPPVTRTRCADQSTRPPLSNRRHARPRRYRASDGAVARQETSSSPGPRSSARPHDGWPAAPVRGSRPGRSGSQSGIASARTRRSATFSQVRRARVGGGRPPSRRATSGSREVQHGLGERPWIGGVDQHPAGPMTVAEPPLVVPMHGSPAAAASALAIPAGSCREAHHEAGGPPYSSARREAIARILRARRNPWPGGRPARRGAVPAHDTAVPRRDAPGGPRRRRPPSSRPFLRVQSTPDEEEPSRPPVAPARVGHVVDSADADDVNLLARNAVVRDACCRRPTATSSSRRSRTGRAARCRSAKRASSRSVISPAGTAAR